MEFSNRANYKAYLGEKQSSPQSSGAWQTWIYHQPGLPCMGEAKRWIIIGYARCFSAAAGAMRSAGLW
ncbi:MAG: hypothetical protein WBB19_06180 [Desulforhopalus sp.]